MTKVPPEPGRRRRAGPGRRARGGVAAGGRGGAAVRPDPARCGLAQSWRRAAARACCRLGPALQVFGVRLRPGRGLEPVPHRRQGGIDPIRAPTGRIALLRWASIRRPPWESLRPGSWAARASASVRVAAAFPRRFSNRMPAEPATAGNARGHVREQLLGRQAQV